MKFTPTAARRTNLCISFLDLSRELRDLVYEYALVAESPISVLNLNDSAQHPLPRQTLGLSPALLATCKGIYEETVSVLYGLNTFRAVLTLDIRQALKWHEVHEALQSLGLSAAFEPADPDITHHSLKPRYTHMHITSIRRLEIKMETSFPTKPHWTQLSLHGDAKKRSSLSDVCKAFIEPGSLDLCIFTTEWFGDSLDWMPAAGTASHCAEALRATMWAYHEWHLEKVMLASSHTVRYLWINDGSPSSASKQYPPSFQHVPKIPKQGRCTTAPLKVGRSLPKKFQLTGQLRRRLPFTRPPWAPS